MKLEQELRHELDKLQEANDLAQGVILYTFESAYFLQLDSSRGL